MVATKFVDFRKGAEGLAALARQLMEVDLFDGLSTSSFWERAGVCLFATRLENDRFR